jgi:Zn-dependent protease
VILNEPPQTSYDVRFQLGSIPVRIHPLFWVLVVVLGLMNGDPDGIRLLLWVGTVFVSILIHELGHIIAMRAFGESGRIVLHSFGGLAISDGASAWGRGRSPKAQIIISLAGPLAGFLFGAMFLIGFLFAGGIVKLEAGLPGILNITHLETPPGASDHIRILFLMIWFVNFYWGLLNLLPIYPLDGGQIARELFQMREPHRGIINSLWLSVFCSAAIAVYCLTTTNHFLAFFFAYFAFSSYMNIQQLRGSGFGRGSRW